MSDEVRPKLAQIPQGGRDNVKREDEEEDSRHHPKSPNGTSNGNGNSNGSSASNGHINSVTLPSFRETYGSLPLPPSHLQLPHPILAPSSHLPSHHQSHHLSHPQGGLPPSHPQSLPQSHPHHQGHPQSHPQGTPPSQHAPPPHHYPDSHSNSHPMPPGPPGPPGHPGHSGPPGPDSHYARMPHPDQAYREGGYPYGHYGGHYSDRPTPHGQYWPQPPNYQPQLPENAPRQRTSIACKYCRKRKIRCSGYQNTPDGKCTNCKKTGNDCVFQPVSSTTSTAFVPVSAIQGGVPPGTPLFGAFGQPLAPNGGRGSNTGPPNGHPGNGHMNGSTVPPQHPGYGPSSPPGYYQQPLMHHGSMDRGPPHGPPPSSQGLPPPSQAPGNGRAHLPLPYPQSHHGYPEDRGRGSKRSRDDEEHEYPNRLPPPPPANYSHPPYYEHGYHRGSEDARRSPPYAQAPNLSPTSSAPRGYSSGAPHPAIPPPLSVGHDTSARRNGSISGATAPSPSERFGTRSPSGEAEEREKRNAASQQPPYLGRDFKQSAAGREIDRTMLNRLGSTRPGSQNGRRGSKEDRVPLPTLHAGAALP